MASDHIQCWQGSSEETFHAFLQTSIQQFKQKRYNSLDHLIEDLYVIYSKCDINKTYDKEKSTAHYHGKALKILRKAFPDGTPENIRCTASEGFLYFIHDIGQQDIRCAEHQSLNLNPKVIRKLVANMVRDTVTLPFVSSVKVAWSEKRNDDGLDNCIVYYYNPPYSGNQQQLEQILHSYRKYIRPYHPSMQDPLDTNVQGHVFADGYGRADRTKRLGKIAHWTHCCCSVGHERKKKRDHLRNTSTKSRKTP